MKLITVMVMMCVIALIGTGLWYRGDHAPQRSSEQTPTTRAAILGVEDLMRNVDRHRGPVSVVGVVSGVSVENQVVALIDTREFSECGLTNCASLTLPVRWAGPVPAIQKTVRVAGQVEESDGKLVFVATMLEELGQ